MRALDLQMNMKLALLRVQEAQGYNVDAEIADTLIAMLKHAYVCGNIGIDHLEDVTAAILRREPVTVLAAGERVVRGDRGPSGASAPQTAHATTHDPPQTQ